MPRVEVAHITLVRQCPLMGDGLPEGEVDDGLIDFDGGSGVIEYSGDVFGGEGVVGIAAWGGVYVESRQVFPTTPSPTITNFKLIGSITFTFNYNHTIQHPRIGSLPFSLQRNYP